MALGLVMCYWLCYTHAVQLYLVQRPAKCPLLQSTVVLVTTSAERQLLEDREPEARIHGCLNDVE